MKHSILSNNKSDQSDKMLKPKERETAKFHENI